MLQVRSTPMQVQWDGRFVQPKMSAALALMAVRARTMDPKNAWVTDLEIAQLPDWLWQWKKEMVQIRSTINLKKGLSF